MKHDNNVSNKTGTIDMDNNTTKTPPVSELSEYFNDPDSALDIDEELDDALAAEEALMREQFEAKDDGPFYSRKVAQQKGIRFKNSEDIAAELSPGRLTGDVKIILHSRQAHRLYHGRRRDDDNGVAPMTGLIRFASQLNQVWQAAGRDDPYADYYLYEIERSLESADATIKELIEELEALKAQKAQRGYNVSIQESTQPIELSLKFAPEFTHKAALTLLEYDYLVRLTLSLRHAALINREEAYRHYMNAAATRIRHAFEMSLRYKRVPVTRDDIAANNGRAQDAAAKYRIKLPQPILDGSVRAEVSPPLPKKRQDAIDLAQQASASRQAKKEQQLTGTGSGEQATGTVTVVTRKKKPGANSSEADK